MRLLFILLFSLAFGFAKAHPRDYWFELDSKEGKEKYVSVCKNYANQNLLDKAYIAASKMIEADLAILPTTQLSLFSQGKSELEKCIQQDPWNTEIRFIRLTIQCQSPWFLDYHDHINEDSQVIIDHLHLNYIRRENPFWKKAITFMLKQSNIPDHLKNQLICKK
jgi:hypothetical protein